MKFKNHGLVVSPLASLFWENSSSIHQASPSQCSIQGLDSESKIPLLNNSPRIPGVRKWSAMIGISSHRRRLETTPTSYPLAIQSGDELTQGHDGTRWHRLTPTRHVGTRSLHPEISTWSRHSRHLAHRSSLLIRACYGLLLHTIRINCRILDMTLRKDTFMRWSISRV